MTRIDAGKATGALLDSSWVTIPGLIAYAMLGPSMGIDAERHATSLVLFLMGAASLYGLGVFAAERAEDRVRPGASERMTQVAWGFIAASALLTAIAAPIAGYAVAAG